MNGNQVQQIARLQGEVEALKGQGAARPGLPAPSAAPVPLMPFIGQPAIEPPAKPEAAPEPAGIVERVANVVTAAFKPKPDGAKVPKSSAPPAQAAVPIPFDPIVSTTAPLGGWPLCRGNPFEPRMVDPDNRREIADAARGHYGSFDEALR